MTKKLLILFFIWIFLEGIFRKWLLNSYATPIFFIKYLIIAFAALIYFTNKNKVSNQDYPFFFLILIYITWCFIEIFNFRITSNYIVKGLGLITHFAFIPLIFLVPKYLNNKDKFIKFFEIIAYISIPLFILGIIQYQSPLDSTINRYVAEFADIARVGGNPRITSVFSYIVPYTSYLNLTIIIFLYLIIIKKTNIYNNLILYFVFLLSIINLFMSGSRAAVFIIYFKLILFSMYLVFTIYRRKQKVLFSFIFIFLAILLLINYTNLGSKSFLAFEQRVVETKEDVSVRIKDNYNLSYYISYAGMVGYGLGTTYQGTASLINDFKDMPYVESENSKIIVELGLLGFVIIYILRLFIFIYSTKVFFKTKDFELKLLTLILILYQLPTTLIFANNIYNYMENMIYWFVVGLIVSINRINSRNKRLVSNNSQIYKINPEYY